MIPPQINSGPPVSGRARLSFSSPTMFWAFLYHLTRPRRSTLFDSPFMETDVSDEDCRGGNKRFLAFFRNSEGFEYPINYAEHS